MTRGTEREKTSIEKLTIWIGSASSLAIHTIAFITFFVLSFLGFLSWDLMFLILTTIVSLEAIYLAIFIQMTVNRQAQELAEVSEDLDEIQEDVEEIQKDVDEIQEDVEDISEEDAEEERLESERKQRQADTLEQLTRDVQQLLTDLESFKKGNPKL